MEEHLSVLCLVMVDDLWIEEDRDREDRAMNRRLCLWRIEDFRGSQSIEWIAIDLKEKKTQDESVF